MQERGWRKKRTLETTDTSGRPLRVTTGLTVDVHGNTVVGMEITAIGPVTVVSSSPALTLDTGSEIAANLHSSLADLLNQQRGRQ